MAFALLFATSVAISAPAQGPREYATKPSAAQAAPASTSADPIDAALVAWLASPNAGTYSQYRKVLGNQPEASVLDLVDEPLRHFGTARTTRSADAQTAAANGALKQLSGSRFLGRPERRLPALLLLRDVRPEDPRAAYLVAEAFAVPSPVFAPGRAAEELLRLQGILRGKNPNAGVPMQAITSLLEFLPEWDAVFFPGDRGVQNRQEGLLQWLGGVRQGLLAGRPLEVRALRDLRLPDLCEECRRLLRCGEQAKAWGCIELLGRLDACGIAACYLRGMIQAATGRRHDPDASRDELLRFCHQTSSEALAAAGPQAGAEVLRQVRALCDLGEDVRLSDLRDRAKQRCEPQKGRKMEAGVFGADRTKLTERVRQLKKALDDWTKEQTDLKARLAAANAALEKARGKFQDYPTEARSGDITRCKTNIELREKALADHAAKKPDPKVLEECERALEVMNKAAR